MRKPLPNFLITGLVVGLMIAAMFYLRENPLFACSLFRTDYLNRVVVYQLTIPCLKSRSHTFRQTIM